MCQIVRGKGERDVVKLDFNKLDGALQGVLQVRFACRGGTNHSGRVRCLGRWEVPVLGCVPRAGCGDMYSVVQIWVCNECSSVMFTAL